MKSDAANDRESLGQFLRRTREEQGLSFAEAVESTKISPNNLKALEEDDYANLPAEAYVNGFYGIYAKYLAIDPDEVRSRYNHQKNLLPKRSNRRSPTPGQLAMQTSSMAEPPSVASHSVIGMAIVAMIVIGSAICWYFSWNPAAYLSQKLRQTSTQQPSPAADQAATAQPMATPPPETATVAPTADPAAAAAAAGGESLHRDAPAGALKAPAAVPQPSTIGSATAPSPNTYVLKATFKEATKLTVKVDDGPAERLSLPAGAVQSWSAGKSIVVTLPAGTTASLTLNDLPLSLPKNPTGEEMTVAIPEYLLE